MYVIMPLYFREFDKVLSCFLIKRDIILSPLFFFIYEIFIVIIFMICKRIILFYILQKEIFYILGGE